jgi:hypothetical protein
LPREDEVVELDEDEDDGVGVCEGVLDEDELE